MIKIQVSSLLLLEEEDEEHPEKSKSFSLIKVISHG